MSTISYTTSTDGVTRTYFYNISFSGEENGLIIPAAGTHKLRLVATLVAGSGALPLLSLIHI